MHVMIISDLDVQLIMLLLDDVRLEVYFLTKKKENVFFLSMLSCLNITMVYYEKYNELS